MLKTCINLIKKKTRKDRFQAQSYIDSKIKVFSMEYVPPNFKLNFLHCPPLFRDNTCLALTHFPLHLAALPTHNQRKRHLLSPYTFGAALFTPETIRPTATLSQSLFTQPGTNRDPRSSWLC